MSREKQIEEMAERIYGNGIPHDTAFHEDCRSIARDLYDAGYRKQSEGEWKDCFNGEYANPTYTCPICGKRTLLKPHITELGNMQIVQALSPFCPHCGAKMKGGAE